MKVTTGSFLLAINTRFILNYSYILIIYFANINGNPTFAVNTNYVYQFSPPDANCPGKLFWYSSKKTYHGKLIGTAFYGWNRTNLSLDSKNHDQ